MGLTLLNPTFRPWLAYEMDKTTAPHHEAYRIANRGWRLYATDAGAIVRSSSSRFRRPSLNVEDSRRITPLYVCTGSGCCETQSSPRERTTQKLIRLQVCKFTNNLPNMRAVVKDLLTQSPNFYQNWLPRGIVELMVAFGAGVPVCRSSSCPLPIKSRG